MDVHLSLTRRGSLSADIYEQLKRAILDGRLPYGASVPATRELARRLAVSRNTVMNAYQLLIAEGFLVGRVGAGTVVAAVPRLPARRAPEGGALRPRPIWRSVAQPAAVRTGATYDFSIGYPDPALFPWDEWRGLVARQLKRPPRTLARPQAAGDPKLRAAIARHVGASRSVRAVADDIIITSGAQQAFDLLSRVLIEPGTCVAVEEPGYTPARRAFEASGARVVGVRVDAEGLDVAALPRDAKLVYVTPSHQFPLGSAMSLARRLALLAWCEQRGAAIIEDDYDSEFRFDGRPLEPLQSLDRHGCVLYVGTFSKVLLPTLRVGFVVAPASVMAALHTAKEVTDAHGVPETQAALAELIEEGNLARHIRRLVRVYRERRELLGAALARYLGEALIPLPSAAGLHTSAYFADRSFDTEAFIERARAARVAVASLRAYSCGRPRAGLVLGYGLIPAAKIDEGVRKLAACIADNTV